MKAFEKCIALVQSPNCTSAALNHLHILCEDWQNVASIGQWFKDLKRTVESHPNYKPQPLESGSDRLQ